MARSQVSEGVTLAAGLKTALAEELVSTGAFPADGTHNIATPAGRYVDTVTHVQTDGVITVTMLNAAPVATDIRGATFNFTPRVNAANDITGWDCGGGTIDVRYLPGSCQP
ncbi:pilin [Halomonas ramblicola]|nr:pilin [Halomonas ramblicola]MDN3520732.1 pilin [Halomonas ramblicola]